MILPFSINEFMYGTKKKERGVEGYQQLKEFRNDDEKHSLIQIDNEKKLY